MRIRLGQVRSGEVPHAVEQEVSASTPPSAADSSDRVISLSARTFGVMRSVPGRLIMRDHHRDARARSRRAARAVACRDGRVRLAASRRLVPPRGRRAGRGADQRRGPDRCCGTARRGPREHGRRHRRGPGRPGCALRPPGARADDGRGAGPVRGLGERDGRAAGAVLGDRPRVRPADPRLPGRAARRDLRRGAQARAPRVHHPRARARRRRERRPAAVAADGPLGRDGPRAHRRAVLGAPDGGAGRRRVRRPGRPATGTWARRCGACASRSTPTPRPSRSPS